MVLSHRRFLCVLPWLQLTAGTSIVAPQLGERPKDAGPITEWGFAGQPLLAPLPGGGLKEDLVRPTSAFAIRTAERHVRERERAEVKAMEQELEEMTKGGGRRSIAWWLFCCWIRPAERRRTNTCMPKRVRAAAHFFAVTLLTVVIRLEELVLCVNSPRSCFARFVAQSNMSQAEKDAEEKARAAGQKHKQPIFKKLRSHFLFFF